MRYVVRWTTSGKTHSISASTLHDAEYLAWYYRGIGYNVRIITPIDLAWEALAQA